MSDPNDLLTPRALRIPLALARKYGRNPAEVEELESVGYLALVRAAHVFDPSRCDSNSDFGRFAAQRVRWEVIEAVGGGGGSPTGTHARRWKKLDRLDAAAVRAIPDAALASEVAIENAELLERLLRTLPPRHRAAYLLVRRDGLSQAEAGARLGVSRGAVSLWLADADAALARRAKFIGRRANQGPPNPQPPRTKRQREASSKFRKEHHAARLALGFIPTCGGNAGETWYLADDALRVLHGPAYGLWRLLGREKPTKGLRPPATFNGLRVVRGREARRLANEEGYRLMIKKEEANDRD